MRYINLHLHYVTLEAFFRDDVLYKSTVYFTCLLTYLVSCWWMPLLKPLGIIGVDLLQALPVRLTAVLKYLRLVYYL